jgi:hypothetical protein
MRAARNVIVVGIRPELRYMLRIAGRVKVWPAETIPQFTKCLSSCSTDLVIIDCRDAPTLAEKAMNYLRRIRLHTHTILIAAAEADQKEPVCDIVLREGITLYCELLNSMKIALVRRRGLHKKVSV